MAGAAPKHFIVTYAPLVLSKAGREASKEFGLPPFIDGSIRREPDLEHVYPSISCLCRAGNFAPHLHEDDVVVYVTKNAPYGTKEKHRRLTAILRVLHTFEQHADSATWYRDRGLPLPNNCMVPGNPPNPVCRSHRMNEYKHLNDDEHFTRCWDRGYEARAQEHGHFLVCQPLKVSLGWDAPVVHGEDFQASFGRVPGTQNPGDLKANDLQKLLLRLKIDVWLSAPRSSPNAGQ